MSDAPLRLAIPGAAGRMGKMIIHLIAETEGLELGVATERAGSPAIGQDAGLLAGASPLGVRVAATGVPLTADVAIDFTAPGATADLVRRAADEGLGLVIGTTGLGEAERSAIERASEHIPIVWAANMSLGMNVLFGLLRRAAAALGPDYDVEIVEAHHRQKKDAPSGTALAIAGVLADALGRDPRADLRHGRVGDVGARNPREIGVHAVRGGDIVGDHTVLFCGIGERLELIHRASSRETFARGALRAAEWLRDRDPGLYDMQDVLGLRTPT
jgi:4-hydroxy-tetrahydrodipicolinate reductase